MILAQFIIINYALLLLSFLLLLLMFCCCCVVIIAWYTVDIRRIVLMIAVLSGKLC